MADPVDLGKITIEGLEGLKHLPKEPRFGSNQIIAMGAGLLPFIVATVALFTDRATFAEWSGHIVTLIPIVTGIALGVSGAIKGVEAWRAGGPAPTAEGSG